MALTIPNRTAATYDPQAAPDSTDIDAMVAGSGATGVTTGCAVSQRAAGANMSVDVAAGTVAVSGVTVAVSSINKTISAADATNPRRDIITVNGSGTVAVTNGTAAATPVKPAIPASSVLLAEVYVPASATSVVTAQITDKRVFLSSVVESGEDRSVTSDVTMTTAGTFYDGATKSLPAGIYDVEAKVSVVAASTANRGFTFKLWDGASTIYDQAEISSTGTAQAFSATVPLCARITLTSTTTVKASVTSNVNGDKIRATSWKGNVIKWKRVG